MALNIKIDAFEGPFDLLFHLIEKNQIDIYDIPIAELTEQYLVYIDKITEHQLDIASEFLVMAATLLSIKSKMLLPSKRKQDTESELAVAEDDYVDPRSDLMHKLLEYKKFKEIAVHLRNKEQGQQLIFKRPPEDLSLMWTYEIPLAEITFEDLKSAFISVMSKEKPEEKVSKVSRDPMPLSRKVIEVYRMLRQKSKLFFSRLYEKKTSKVEIIMTFLAVLELVKMNRINAVQEKQFGEIVLTCREV
ncbi:MAG: segregation/condensation protein A [Thermoanaerobacteraceae bacterium]|nr:segregation/condensation protein A [Thermoanaerobacteraceae bacterium]